MNKVALTAFVSLLIFSVTVPNTAYCQSPPPTDPYVYVLVWSYNYLSYLSLEPAILRYKQDLENAGFSVEIKSNVISPVLPGNAEGIRELLQDEALTHEIAGVLMVGDVPYASYEMEIEGYNYTFPWDLYYMDLDGNWTDSDGNGVYDGHSSGEGDLGPEIWTGRLYASTMTGDEEELLINYFDKNHHFRTGELTLPRRALAYVDDDFLNHIDRVNSSLRLIYGNETTLVTDPETTNATHYKNTLNDTLGYEWLHLEAHGNFEEHAFNTPGGWTYVCSSEVRSVDPHAFFYNIMACDSADFTLRNLPDRTDYIGGSYIFADTYGLLVVSSAKPGAMSNFYDFYKPISEGKCIGQAFKEWFEKNGELHRILYYGLTILGDPTLRAPRIYNQTKDIAVTSVVVGSGCCNVTEVHSGCNVAIKVTMKNEGIFVETINVTAYYDNNTIETLTVNLFPGADRILTFIWNTTGVPLGNYTLKAEASILPQELDIEDNILVDGTIRIRITGDVNDDGKVNVLDMLLVKLAIGSQPGEPKWNQHADINCDDIITVLDMLLVKINLG